MNWIKENWFKVILVVLSIIFVFLILDTLDKNSQREQDRVINEVCSFLDENSIEYGRCIDNATDVLQQMSLGDL